MSLKTGKKGTKTVKSVSTPSIRRLYFDIETSPNIVTTWNVGYKLNIDYTNIVKERAIICICYKWEHSDSVYALQWEKGDDKKMIKQFLEVIKTADEVVGHNGDNYDLKWFRTRCLFHGIKSLPQFKSIDTLKISRREFRFNSNRLDYIGQFLGLGRKIKTDYGLWQKVIAGDEKALNDMITYCVQDVRILEKVYLKLAGYTQAKTHVGVMKGHDKCSCPSCGSNHTVSDGNKVSSAGTVKKRMHCKSCDTYFTTSLTAYNKSRGIE